MSHTAHNGAIEVDLVDVFGGLWRARGFIVLIALASALVGAAYESIRPVQITASRQVNIEYPITMAARERCGFGFSPTILDCAAGHFTDELRAEMQRLHPGEVSIVRSSPDVGGANSSQVGQFTMTAKADYSLFDQRAKSSAEEGLRASAAWDLTPAVEALRTRFLSDAALYKRALSEIEIEGVRSSETYGAQFIAVRLTQLRLESGQPRMAGAGTLQIASSLSTASIIKKAAYWGLVGLVLSWVLIVTREISRQFS